MSLKDTYLSGMKFRLRDFIPSFFRVTTSGISGTLATNTTSAATIADTNETDLWTYTLPANTLAVDGQMLRVTAWGDFGATANNKTVHFYIGTNAITSASPLASNGVGWTLTIWLTRTAAAAIQGKAQLLSNASVNPTTRVGLVYDTATALAFKITGTNGTAAANDIVFKGAVVELLNA